MGLGSTDEQCPQSCRGGRVEGVDLCMKQPKRILVLSSSEYRFVLHVLLHFRNKLIAQGRYPDAIDELMIKLQKAKRRH